MEPRADPELARLGGQIVRGDRALEERLDAGDQHPHPPVPPRRQGRDTGGRLIGATSLAPLVGQGRPRI